MEEQAAREEFTSSEHKGKKLNKFAILKNNLLTNIIESEENLDIQYVTSILQKAFDDSEIVLITEDTGEPILLNSEFINKKFYSPRPHPSWIIKNEKWSPPIDYPSDNNLYYWNESCLSWEKYNTNLADIEQKVEAFN